MDQQLKSKIIYSILAILAIFTLYQMYSNYKIKKSIQNNTIVIERGTLKDYSLEFINLESPYKYNLVDLKTQEKFTDIPLSKECINIEDKIKTNPIMKLVKVVRFNTYTEEKIVTFDRAYDYLCTNKNMVEEDAELLKKIQEAKEEYIKEYNKNMKKQ